jgi:uncharacterized C2H2 Zn-finger protein
LPSVISRCIICGQFFNSIKELKNHKDKNHRITNARMKGKRVVDEDNIKDQLWALGPGLA